VRGGARSHRGHVARAHVSRGVRRHRAQHAALPRPPWVHAVHRGGRRRVRAVRDRRRGDRGRPRPLG
jgi:hypothetical protein